MLWSLNIVPSTTVCARKLQLDRLPTRANLSRRGVLLGNMWCPLCQKGVETTQHLFITCKVVQKIWDQCESWVGNVIVRHEDINIHF